MRRFQSILFDEPDRAADVGNVSEPEFFGDVNLDQIVQAVTAGRDEYEFTQFFYAPLHDVAAVHYRHEIFRDLERDSVREPVEEFAQKMHGMRQRLAPATTSHYRYQQQRWFLDAIDAYLGAVASLNDRLTRVDISSRGMRALREYLTDYVDTDDFRALVAETRTVREMLAKVKYCVHIRGPRVRVTHYGGEADYSTDVEKTFDRFKQGAVKDYRVKYRDGGMNHVEAQVLDCVARLYRDTFRTLDQYCARHRDYLDTTIATFDREAQFYLAYLSYIQRISSTGLRFCYPDVSKESREISADDAFDLALATKLVPHNETVVCNSFRLDGHERIVVVTGPNQGGKTTFARMFGQLPYLASLGCPVPAGRARLFLPDRVFSHFEREESLATLRGKLDDELVRIHDILDQATSDSIIVMNESFASTTLNDARFIGTEVLNRIIRLRSPAVYVTFVDELASLDETVVSMVAAIVPDDPAQRTYKITRTPADGLAYAAAIAAKYGLTYDSLRRRVTR